jgi:hypothetical protein
MIRIIGKTNVKKKMIVNEDPFVAVTRRYRYKVADPR